MARQPRPAPVSSEYDTVPGLGRKVVRLEERQDVLDERLDTFEFKLDGIGADIENLARELLAKAAYQDGAKAVLQLGWKGICWIAGSGVGLIAAIAGGLAYYAPHLFTR